MARMPDAIWLGEHSPRIPMTRHDIVCVHTIVGFAPAHAAHFSVKRDGTILQSRDTTFQSGANLDGNPRVIAVENEDHGAMFGSWSGSDVPRLADAQVEANARILRWAHKQHGVPLQLCPDSRPGSRGLAYHRQGIDGNFTDGFPGRRSGGEAWTEHFGKVCPGRRRIEQIPLILKIAKEGDDMQLSDKLFPDADEPDLAGVTIGDYMRRDFRTMQRTEERLERVLAELDDVDDAVSKAVTVEQLRQQVGRLRDLLKQDPDPTP